MKIFRREFSEALEAIRLMDNPERLLEKEYHFDEGLGQSLDEHVVELKTKFPGMNVQTRRDRDGFAVVKVFYKQNYKYSLDKIENWDKTEAQNRINQTVETLLQHILPDGSTEKTL